MKSVHTADTLIDLLTKQQSTQLVHRSSTRFVSSLALFLRLSFLSCLFFLSGSLSLSLIQTISYTRIFDHSTMSS